MSFYEGHVFPASTPHPWHIYARLNGDDHPLAQDISRVRSQTRRFVDLHTHAVPHTMWAKLSVAGAGNHITRGPVDLSSFHAITNSRYPRGLRALDNFDQLRKMSTC